MGPRLAYGHGDAEGESWRDPHGPWGGMTVERNAPARAQASATCTLFL